MFYLLIGGCVVIDVLSSIVLRMWADTSKLYLLILGVIGFATTGVLFGYSMHYKGLAIANIIWIGLSAVILTLVAFYFFKENISIVNAIGMLLVTFGLILLN